MTRTLESDLRRFTQQVLQRHGALVEWAEEEAEGVAVIEPRTAAVLGVEGETVTLSCAADNATDGLRVNLAGDFLDVMQRVLDADAHVAALRIPDRYLKQKGLEETVERQFTWLNAKVIVGPGRPCNVEYHTWWFHALLVSEDRWETRLGCTVNSATGGGVELPDLLDQVDRQSWRPAGDSWVGTLPLAARQAREQTLALAAGFLARLDDRLIRDRKRLKEYYGALRKEGRRSRGRRQTIDAEQMAARDRAVDLELRRKLAELEERYAIEATLRPLTLLRCEIPVVAVPLTVHRKKSRREHLVYWNSLLKRIEPFVCQQCGTNAYSVAFTNDEVEPRCAACNR